MADAPLPSLRMRVWRSSSGEMHVCSSESASSACGRQVRLEQQAHVDTSAPPPGLHGEPPGPHRPEGDGVGADGAEALLVRPAQAETQGMVEAICEGRLGAAINNSGRGLRAPRWPDTLGSLRKTQAQWQTCLRTWPRKRQRPSAPRKPAWHQRCAHSCRASGPSPAEAMKREYTRSLAVVKYRG
jgi:hypothetical protein